MKLFNRSITLDCYTTDPQVYEHAKIQQAGKFIPDWWKSLPKDVPFPTMRQCAGFIDLYKKSFVLPLWSDLDVSIDGNQFQWQYADNLSSAGNHAKNQFGEWIGEDSILHLKLNSPWRLRCDKEVFFQWSDATWEEDRVFKYMTPTAIVEYKYQHATNVNLLFNKERVQEIRLHHGTPLVFITPITENKVVLKHHLVSESKMKEIDTPFPAVNVGRYMAARKHAKKKESNCPFGFGKN